LLRELTRLSFDRGSKDSCGFELGNGFGRGRSLLESDHTRSARGGVAVSESCGLFHLLFDPMRPRG
jgi:hypothetical protein